MAETRQRSQQVRRAVPIAPGAHIVIRDAVWRVRRVDRTSAGSHAWDVIGISEIVRDQHAIFLEDYEPSVRVLDPATTTLELDHSAGHRDARLYIEGMLRDVPPTSDALHIGHRAAMDVMDYQLVPAGIALSRPRQRILIADAVGLGKTLEAGILMSELIQRGRGKRILVVAVKSMLTQFQKEMWCRFSIPLVRLDSTGLQKIRRHIPTNQNPFYYFDRAIISIDTLKQNNAFRTHVEKAHWDIIVIDEAHNVAVRGGKRSQRARIAETLAERSDSLILLSATPHDGKARSFASLMNMLDPTAIANPDDYTRDDIEGLFVRRFKKNIIAQLGESFKERDIKQVHAGASATEEAAFDALVDLDFRALDGTRGSSMLYKTSLAKALFSSPAACARTLLAPLERSSVRKQLSADFFTGGRKEDRRAASQILDAAVDELALAQPDSDLCADIQQLAELARRLESISRDDFSKYQTLLTTITSKKQFGWTPKKKDDRLVIFSESIETLRFLRLALAEDLKLKDEQIEILHGRLSDIEQQRLVEEFGKTGSKLRVLLASDVASEGINLHYLCHRLVHFDIPWSLMVFQQRNGRIDRYGQEKKPQIVYLLTDSNNERIAGDRRILELLIERDEQAVKNINRSGDPSALMGAYSVDEQELVTASMIEAGVSAEDAGRRLDSVAAIDPLELLLSGAFNTTGDTGGAVGDTEANKADATTQATATATAADTFTPLIEDKLSLFASDFDFVRASLDRLSESEGLQSKVDDAKQLIEIQLPPDTEEARRRRVPGFDLRRRFDKFPREVLPDDGVLVLNPKAEAMQRAITDARGEDSAWPVVQYLWPLNPVLQWCQDRNRAAFPRHSAPVLTLLSGLRAGEEVIVTSGLLPNERSQPLVHRWFAACFIDGHFQELEDFDAFVTRSGIAERTLPNRRTDPDISGLQRLVPAAVDETLAAMHRRRARFEDDINATLQVELERLECLKERQLEQLEREFGNVPSKRAARDQRRRRIDATFDRYLDWVQQSMTTSDAPFVQVIAALRTEEGASQ